MGMLERFEKGIENIVQTVFAKTFRSGVKPVELVSALKKECDARAAVVDRQRTLVPNEYTIALSLTDRETIANWGEDVLLAEFTTALHDHAGVQRYSFVGNVKIEFLTDDTLPKGRFSVTSRSTRSPAAPVFAPHTATNYPLLEIDGRLFHLTGEKTTIGRGSDADITVDDSGVSRIHLQLEQTPFGTILTDLGSTNGTFVEEQQVQEVTLLDGNAITIGRTTILYWDAVPNGEDY